MHLPKLNNTEIAVGALYQMNGVLTTGPDGLAIQQDECVQPHTHTYIHFTVYVVLQLQWDEWKSAHIKRNLGQQMCHGHREG